MDQDVHRIITTSEDRVAADLQARVESALTGVGLLCRVFARVKAPGSVVAKRDERARRGEPYGPGGKRMQDLFGVRVVLYFADDVPIAERIVGSILDHESTAIDDVPGDQFGPVRYNIVYRLPPDLAALSPALKSLPFVDPTVEVQFRSVLSEGWHEVEHDLRYKFKDTWSPHEDLTRAFNSILATLEGSDWTMRKVFDDLAYRHYKAREHADMVRAKFRLRLRPAVPSEPVWPCLARDHELAKALFRVDREEYFNHVLELEGQLPVTSENVVYQCNRFFLQSDEVRRLEPAPVAEVLERWESRAERGLM